MPGPMPKDPATLTRRNKVSTKAVLRLVKNPKIPAPPAGTDWHEQALIWWGKAWSSPMRQEWTDSDANGIELMLAVQHAYWKSFDEGDYRIMPQLMNSFNTLAKQYGLSPMSRRSLQWQIEQGEAAEEKTIKRRQSRTKTGLRKGQDPRELLA